MRWVTIAYGVGNILALPRARALFYGPALYIFWLEVGLIGSCRALAVHDWHTRRDLLALVDRELPVGASLGDMEAFMQRHTARFAFDDRFKHEYGGILPQSAWDKNLFDRKVAIDLHFDKDHRFTTAEVNVSYTFV